jgi:2',3'-cyclic-nucleotide 2'-phosphodiesterase (5'-nucleotidase family)
VLALAAVAAAASGCGAAASTGGNSADDFTGQRKAVAQLVDDLQDAASRRDGAKICNELLAANLIAGFKARGEVCKDVVTDTLTDADIYAMTVDAVTVTGVKATAVVLSDSGTGDDQRNIFAFVKGKNGAWKISSFG